jgi:hypothetical protein
MVLFIVLLAVFSIIGIVASAEEPRSSRDQRDDPIMWMMLGRR